MTKLAIVALVAALFDKKGANRSLVIVRGRRDTRPQQLLLLRRRPGKATLAIVVAFLAAKEKVVTNRLGGGLVLGLVHLGQAADQATGTERRGNLLHLAGLDDICRGGIDSYHGNMLARFGFLVLLLLLRALLDPMAAFAANVARVAGGRHGFAFALGILLRFLRQGLGRFFGFGCHGVCEDGCVDATKVGSP